MTNEDQDQLWQELAQKSQTGDKQSYQKLLELIYPVIKAFVISKMGPSYNYEDITQECLISIHKALHTYDPKRSFKPWLFAITRYKLIDFLRKMQREASREVNHPEIFATIAAPETNSISEENGLLVHRALDALPADMKQAIVLTKMDGLSTNEAAEKLGVSPVALRSRVSRAYKILRKKLEKEVVKQI